MVNNPVHHDIPFNIIKSSIAIFLAEFLTKVLKEEEANPILFEFLHSSIQLFDQKLEGQANFHLVFLYELSKFLGFYPDTNYSEQNRYFNLRNGYYSGFKETDQTSLGSELSILLFQISKLGFQSLDKLELSRMQRTSLLEAIISYYRYHLPGVGEIKSLSVFNEIFKA